MLLRITATKICFFHSHLPAAWVFLRFQTMLWEAWYIASPINSGLGAQLLAWLSKSFTCDLMANSWHGLLYPAEPASKECPEEP
jgi:hypothetical protein